MPIALKIISYQRLTPGQQALFRPDLQRFSIGRNRDNHWALPDPQRFMSGTHCWLEERDGAWFLTDTSTNGVYVNGSDQRVQKNASVAVGNGDRIRLGDYEMEVEIDDASAAAASPASETTDPFGNHDWEGVDSPRAAEPVSDAKSAHQPESGLLSDSLSIDALFQLGEPRDKEEAPPPSLARQGDQASPLQQHFQAPSVAPARRKSIPPDTYAAPVAGIADIPDNWDEDTGPAQSRKAEPEPEGPPITQPSAASPPARGSGLPQPPPAAAPEAGPVSGSAAPVEPPAPMPGGQPQPAPRVAGGHAAMPRMGSGNRSALAAFAAGAGLDPGQFDLEDEAAFFANVGELLKTMTQGLMQAIASRGQIKSEFRLEQTMIAPTQNNPLKFSVSAQEALVRLLARTDSAYLTGPVAAAEAIDDINAHQLAVVAGTEAALKSLLRRFKPATLESRLGGDSALGKALPMIKKAKYWEFYKALYDEVSEATGDDFQKFFGSEFSDAYEKQLERLKTSRKETNK
jgi:type VI secretion system protein